MTRRVFMPHQSAMITTCLSFVSLINVGPSESISSSRRLLSMWCSRHMRNPPQRIHAASSLARSMPFICLLVRLPFPLCNPNCAIIHLGAINHSTGGCKLYVPAFRSWPAAWFLHICALFTAHGSLYIWFGRQINFARADILFVGTGIFTVCKFAWMQNQQACNIQMFQAKYQNTISLLINFGIHITWEHTKWRIFG